MWGKHQIIFLLWLYAFINDYQMAVNQFKYKKFSGYDLLYIKKADLNDPLKSAGNYKLFFIMGL